MGAAATIATVEGCCLRYLICLKGQRWSQLNCKWAAGLHEALGFLYIGQPVNNGLFKKWVKRQRRDLEYNITSWPKAFLRSFSVLALAWRGSMLFGRSTHTECRSGSGRSISLDIYAYAACVCVDR